MRHNFCFSKVDSGLQREADSGAVEEAGAPQEEGVVEEALELEGKFWWSHIDMKVVPPVFCFIFRFLFFYSTYIHKYIANFQC